MMLFLLFLLVLALAFANGANDVSRGIATLVGSGRARQNTAIMWGTVWTVAGAASGAWLATRLLTAYSSGSFLTGAEGPPVLTPAYFLATAVSATIWVGLATWRGLPVSSTHALTGGLIGAACAAFGAGALDWMMAASRFLLPLALSPLLAFALILLFHRIGHRFCSSCARYCVCLEQRVSMVPTVGTVALRCAEGADWVAGPADECDASPLIRTRLDVMDLLHWSSAAMISFARGLNDMPKILALGWAAGALGASLGWAYGLGALAMGAGCWMGGRRVTRTMGHDITRITPEGGFLANAVSALLVTTASPMGLPVSTTHVTGAAIMGLGLKDGRGMHWNTVRHILFAWLVTMPSTLILAWVFYRTLS